MTIEEIINYIITGKCTPQEIQALTIALNEYRKLRKFVNYGLKLKDEVTIENVKPHYWIGCKGKITKISPRQTHVWLQITELTHEAKAHNVRFMETYGKFPMKSLVGLNTPLAMIEEGIAEESSALQSFLSS